MMKKNKPKQQGKRQVKLQGKPRGQEKKRSNKGKKKRGPKDHTFKQTEQIKTSRRLRQRAS